MYVRIWDGMLDSFFMSFGKGFTSKAYAKAVSETNKAFGIQVFWLK